MLFRPQAPLLFLAIIKILAIGALTGCVSSPQSADPEGTYLTRAVVYAKGDVVVTASVPDGNEIEEIFGARLELVGIQPVWLKIENLGAHSYVLFLKSIDPHYFSPYEVARRASAISESTTETLYPPLRDLEIERFIAPGADVSGFVYTHLDEGLKAFNVDLLSNQRLQSFNIAVDVPGLTTDYDDFDRDLIYGDKIESLEEDELRAWLQSLTCCTLSEDGVAGDPLNVVFVGKIEDIRAALVSQDWDVTAKVTPASLRRILTAFLFGSRYRYAPISGLYVFERVQDMTFQKARAVIDERNHIRLWLAPVSYQGIPVWVGHISRDAGIKFSGRIWPPTTHVIDPAVDEARFYLEQDLLYSNNVQKFGLVTGAGATSHDAPRFNAEGDPYFTDGFRAVFFIDDSFRSMGDVELLNWSLPSDLEPFRDSIFLMPTSDD
jgi:hypothetical protein